MRISLCCFLFLSNAVYADTFTVDTTSDASISGCSAAAADCSLRGAVSRANAGGSTDTIAFAIPVSDQGCVAATGVCRISYLTGGEALIQPVLVDGYTQPGAAPNTLDFGAGGSNAVLKIELHGGSCPSCSTGAFRMGVNAVVRGLVINGFSTGPGLSTGDFFFSLSGNNSRIEGNFIGTDASGTSAIPNREGITVQGGSNRTFDAIVGGNTPATRNLISGNTGVAIVSAGFGTVIRGNLIGTNAGGTAAIGNGEGVIISACGFLTGLNNLIGGSGPNEGNLISGNAAGGIRIGTPNGGCGNATGARVLGNFIGTDFSGVHPIPNGNGSPTHPPGAGVSVVTGGEPTAFNVVGGIGNGEGNVIAFSGEGASQGSTNLNGLTLPSGAFVSVRGNRIRGSRQLGIDIGGGGAGQRNPNDPGDPDSFNPSGDIGRIQNHPEILTAQLTATTAAIDYRVDSTAANSIYPLQVDFYLADGDEGQTWLGTDTYVAAEAQTTQNVALTLPPGTLPTDAVIVATAVDSDGNTSEFSYHPATLSVLAPVPSACTTSDGLFCNGYESGAASLLVTVRALATAGPFKPNGRVTVSDDRGASCSATLHPVAAALTSEGECLLVNSGAPGNINITATLDTLASAFGSPAGGNVVGNASFTVQ